MRICSDSERTVAVVAEHADHSTNGIAINAYDSPASDETLLRVNNAR